MDASHRFWIKHAEQNTGIAAIEPNIRWLGYHVLSRRTLQRWTIDRLRAYRRRYRLGVDLGCGDGDWTELIAPLCDSLHACDLAPEFVQRARRRTAWHRACQVDVSDIRDFPIPDGADLVYVGAALLYLPDADVREVFARIARAASPGAHIVVRDWCTVNFGMRSENPQRGSTHRSPQDLRRFGESAGLRLVELRSSFSIYGELGAGWMRPLVWPLRALVRLVTLPWRRASHTLRFVAPG